MILKLNQTEAELGPYSAGVRMTPAEFDEADFEEGWSYELIRGILVVSPIPLPIERDPNEELGYYLRLYRDSHPDRAELDTYFEQTIVTGENRRRADRTIYFARSGPPLTDDVPTIIVEFVSEGKRNWLRDYVEKKDEYLALGVREYWVFNRFEREMTIFTRQGKRERKRVIKEKDTITSPNLPGFELLLAKLLSRTDRLKG